MSVTDHSLLFVSRGAIVSTAVLCSQFSFVTYGPTGPTFSPDQHWVLVDVLGPKAPGAIVATHALVEVRSGRIVFADDFARVLGIVNPPGTLAWASGRRQTLRYGDDKTVSLPERDGKALPIKRCATQLP